VVVLRLVVVGDRGDALLVERTDPLEVALGLQQLGARALD
jgi:hypothetical protein